MKFPLSIFMSLSIFRSLSKFYTHSSEAIIYSGCRQLGGDGTLLFPTVFVHCGCPRFGENVILPSLVMVLKHFVPQLHQTVYCHSISDKTITINNLIYHFVQRESIHKKSFSIQNTTYYSKLITVFIYN